MWVPRAVFGSISLPQISSLKEDDVQETPIEVTQKYVDHLNWPASKDEVLESAQSNGAPDDVVELIRAMDKDTFAGINDVHNSLWMDT